MNPIATGSENEFRSLPLMYSKSRLALKYLHYYFTASSGKGHGIHSPFIFSFITRVLNDRLYYPAYDSVENLRKQLLNDNTELTIEDFGAGSSFSKTSRRTIASIVKNSAKQKKIGQLLFRMIKEYQPQTVIELGTSAGVTTAYLSLAKPDAILVTMEGAKEVAAVATGNFDLLGLRNISMEEGNFDNTLPAVIHKLSSVDFAFVDGNHRLEPTLNYFQQLLTKTNNDSILVFDDIHWSVEMEKAWSTVREHPSIRCTIDLFFAGIVFLRQEFSEKQHFTIRF